jgi:hypothetical protein
MCCAPASRRVAGDVIPAHTENLSEIALSKPLKMAGLQRSKIIIQKQLLNERAFPIFEALISRDRRGLQ